MSNSEYEIGFRNGQDDGFMLALDQGFAWAFFLGFAGGAGTGAIVTFAIMFF